MNTLKSAALVMVLLGVLYGVYVALNKPLPPDVSPSAEEMTSPLVEYGGSSNATGATSLPPPLLGTHDHGVSPASSHDSRGRYQPNLDTGSLPPPTTSSFASVPSDPVAGAAGGLQRSTYEAPPLATSGTTSSTQAPSLTPVEPATATESSATPSTSPAVAAYELRRDLQEAEQLIASGKHKSALAKLTPYYANTDLAPEQRATVMAWLDALAAKVIYSGEHLLASSHQVRRGETLYDVASQYNVEYRLLQNINRREVSDPLVLVPATQLKVVPGPFRADVNLTTNEITLLLNDLYAGRFPLALGDQPPQPGDYKVVDKKQKTYVGLDGRMIPANDPANPYGGWWISLGGEVCIHGSPATPGPSTLGCISLSTQDAQDAYGILSIGSDVKIHR